MSDSNENQTSDLWWSAAPQTAATLVILYDSPDGLQVVLTVRSLNMRHYPGDTALPGGRADAGEDWWTTAFREANEEIGFDESRFDITRVGELPAHLSAHFLLVKPVICHVKFQKAASGSNAGSAAKQFVTLHDIAPLPSGDEVACVYAMPLNWFLSKDNLIRKQVVESEWLGNKWYYYQFKVNRPKCKMIFSDAQQRRKFTSTKVVGLTAHILVDAARYTTGKAPNFDHFEFLGNKLAITSALKLGLFESLQPKV